ncbi:hypothetical protein BD626DRAFT_77243 [Schizophyllum amplum]|uniref:Uncharacterized protein n=1 Tax=Schizophyllum amplum TaxID=97359 RepID=A0A550C9D3_9AGAR|nr:hypothetical protein BD626DRAFT_77243 [Auriculariopsis ampla]
MSPTVASATQNFVNSVAAIFSSLVHSVLAVFQAYSRWARRSSAPSSSCAGGCLLGDAGYRRSFALCHG